MYYQYYSNSTLHTFCNDLPLRTNHSRYQGFQAASVSPSPTPNAAGQKCKMAQVLFDSPDLASVAKEALDGFALKKGWAMSVVYI
jgi:U2 small nuclear ribonucleoprotein B''